MEAPATSGRPPAGFMTLTSWPLLYHSTAGSTSQGSLAQGSHVDFSSQQPSAPIRLPTRAWLPSFRLGGSGSNKWSNKSHLHRPFALGVGAGTGGSMLVSLHQQPSRHANLCPACTIRNERILVQLTACCICAVWQRWSSTTRWILAVQEQRYLIKLLDQTAVICSCTHELHLCVAKSKGKAKKRILVLMSDTGGGHRASAEAIRSGFQILYGNQYQVSHLATY